MWLWRMCVGSESLNFGPRPRPAGSSLAAAVVFCSNEFAVPGQYHPAPISASSDVFNAFEFLDCTPRVNPARPILRRLYNRPHA